MKKYFNKQFITKCIGDLILFFEDKKINIVLGAGASSGVCQSTTDLTKLLLDWTQYYEPLPKRVYRSDLNNPLDPFQYSGIANQKTYFKAIYDNLAPHFEEGKEINFEGLLNFSSGLDMYVTANYTIRKSRYKSYFRIPFSFRGIWKNFDYPHVHTGVATHSADYILNSMTSKYMANPDLKETPQNKLIFKITRKIKTVNVFSLNYDCVPEAVLDKPITGFDENFSTHSVFSPESLLIKNKDHRFIQLHGSCKFALPPEGVNSGDLSFVRYNNESVAEDIRKNSMTQAVWAQDGTPMISPYMITGHRKADAILHEPFLSMWMDFTKHSVSSNRLLVVGYSGGDFHVNAVLKNSLAIWKKRKIKFKVAIITFLPSSLIVNDSVHWHHNTGTGLDTWKFQLLEQIRLMLGDAVKDLYLTLPFKTQRSELLILGNQDVDVLVCLTGVEGAVEKSEEIIGFLK